MKTLESCRVNVMVSNMDAAIEFYHNLLGLEVLARYGNHYAELKTPEMIIGLHPASKPVEPGYSMSIGFGVTDFDGAVKELEAKGVLVSVQAEEWIRLANFADGDGNRLYLAEVK